jgi:hypothetical protein
MAIAVVMGFKGATLDQYDQVMEKMGLDDTHEMPEGGVLHFVQATADGIRVTDVWDTRADYEKFAQEQIGPYSQEVGVPAPPEVTYSEIHNYLVKSEAQITA